MKIKSLKISNIRGIRDLTISLDGKNLTVWGPNGTGKSGVVDSVDFLLTGEITRLVGKGTKDISLKRHGIHIDASADESFVEATVNIPGSSEDIILRRKMSNPSKIEVEGCDDKLILPIIDLAKRGQHVLSRREILTFITAEPNTRATQIQNLLNIGEVEKTRKNLQSISNTFSKYVKSASAVFEQAKSTVASAIKVGVYDEVQVIEYINSQRKILGGSDLTKFKYKDLRSGIDRPGTINKDSIDLATLEKELNFIGQDFIENENFSSAIKKMYSSLIAYKEKSNKSKSLLYKQLYANGIKLIEEDSLNNCPLCENEWDKDLLTSNLREKEDALKNYEKVTKEFINSCKEVAKLLSGISNLIQKSIKSLNGKAVFKNDILVLSKWNTDLSDLLVKLNEPTLIVELLEDDRGQIVTALEPLNKNELISNLLPKLTVAFPKARPDQVAWETLIALEENLKVLEQSDNNYALSKQKEAKANILINKWTVARDKTLQELYSNIEEKFTQLYRDLHGDDESGFTAELSPEKAALNFHVDFHGRGNHAPHALHSEGHQDSMGLCLFLALADYLAQGVIDIVLLDDVVMSVDSEHRRSLCSVLKKFFPNKQFIITTHDQTWANQLKTEGVTSSRTSLQFYNWSLEGGPQTNFESSLWNDIDSKINDNDIPGAAAKLRRGAEDFFESACDLLEAKVTYRQNRRWELGQFMPPAVNRLKEILKKSKIAARSWGDDATVKEITDYITIINQVNSRTQSEQWGVNSTVHYNEWANLQKNDFVPIKEAFSDLFSVFKCNTCDRPLRTVKSGLTVQALKCPCGKTNFNLSSKK